MLVSATFKFVPLSALFVEKCLFDSVYCHCEIFTRAPSGPLLRTLTRRDSDALVPPWISLFALRCGENREMPPTDLELTG